MKLGNYVKWFAGGSFSGSQESQPPSIFPVAWEYRHLLQEDPADIEETDRIDEVFLSKLDPSWFDSSKPEENERTRADLTAPNAEPHTGSNSSKSNQSVQLLKQVFSSLQSTNSEAFANMFETKLEELVRTDEVLSRRLARKTSANYDKFCLGIKMVAEIRETAAQQTQELAKLRIKNKAIKEHYYKEINTIIERSNRKERRLQVLNNLEVIEQSIGGFNKAYLQFTAALREYNCVQKDASVHMSERSGLAAKVKEIEYGQTHGVLLNHLEDPETNQDVFGFLPAEEYLERLLHATQVLLKEVSDFQLREQER